MTQSCGEPDWLVRALVGEMCSVSLSGQRVPRNSCVRQLVAVFAAHSLRNTAYTTHSVSFSPSTFTLFHNTVEPGFSTFQGPKMYTRKIWRYRGIRKNKVEFGHYLLHRGKL